MIIVLEGADGTGKTTLAEKLKLAFPGSKYIHATWSRELDCRMLEYHMGILSDAYKHVVETRTPAIIDRLWLSEAVYAEVFRAGSKYPNEARIMDKFIEMIGGFNIVCLADDIKKHAERFDVLKSDRVEMYQNVSMVVKLYNQMWDANYEEWGIYLKYGYLQDIHKEGGLQKRKNYICYSIEKEGQNIDNFIEIFKYQFEEKNPYWGRK